MKVRDMFFWLFVFAVFTSLLLLASGSIERISIHAIDANLEVEASPVSVMDIVSANHQADQSVNMWPIIMIVIITSVLFIILFIGVLYFSSPVIKDFNRVMKTMKRPLAKPKPAPRHQSPYIIEPVQPIQLGAGGNMDNYSDDQQLPQEVDTSWLEN